MGNSENRECWNSKQSRDTDDHQDPTIGSGWVGRSRLESAGVGLEALTIQVNQIENPAQTCESGRVGTPRAQVTDSAGGVSPRGIMTADKNLKKESAGVEGPETGIAWGKNRQSNNLELENY